MLIGICSSTSTNPFIIVQNTTLAVVSLLINIISIFASLIFIKKNLKTDLENSLNAVLASSASTAICYMTIVTYIQRDKLTDIFAAFQLIHDKCMCHSLKLQFENFPYVQRCNCSIYYSNWTYSDKNIDPEQIIQEANKRSEMIQKFIDCFVGLCLITTAIQMIGSLIYSFLRFGYANPDILYRPFRMV